MLSIDLAARASTIALLLLVGVVLLRGQRGSAFAWAGAAFFGTIAAYLILGSSAYSPIPGLHWLLSTLAFASPAAFWIFSHAFFDEDRVFTRNNLAIAAGYVFLGFLQPAADFVPVAYYGASVVIVIAALASVFGGRPSDLVEPRRHLRVVFTVLAGIEMVIVLTAELLLLGSETSPLLDVVKSTAALWLTTVFSAWLLAPRAELIAAAEPNPARKPEPRAVSEDDRFRASLLDLMRNERVYRREGLTIGALAAHLDMPEYRLRRVINQQLGYRNFNTFLSHFRVDEACRILADPASQRLPILNLAMDLGYGSLGPFNRAFRAQMGQSPTEYRRAQLAASTESVADNRNRQPNLKIAAKF